MQSVLSKSIAVALLATAPILANGATFEWTGFGGTPTSPTSGVWSDPASWATGLPVSSSTTALSFGGNAGYFSTNDFAETFKVNTLRFSSSSPITLQGGTIELANDGAAAPQILLNTPTQVSFWDPIVNNSALTISGTGSGLILFGQASSFTDGLISGAGSITINTAPTGLTAFFAPNTYSGDTTLTQGKLAFGSSSDGAPGSFTSGPVGTGTLHLNGGLIRASSAGSFSLSNDVTIGGNITLGDPATGVRNSLTFAGPITLTGSNATRVLTLNAPSATDTMAIFSGPIRDAGSKNGITVSGLGQTGTLIFEGANTYGGTTTVNAGTLIVRGANVTTGATIVNGGKLSAEQTSGTPLGSGAITVNGGTLEFVPATTATTSTGSIALNGGVLSIAPTGVGDVVDVAAANLPGSTFTYGGNGIVALNHGFNAGLRYIIGPSNAAANSVLSGTNKGALLFQFADVSESNLGTIDKVIVNGGVATKNGIVSPTILGQRLGDAFGVFLGYDSSNGFVRAAETTRTGTFTAAQNEITVVNGVATANTSNPYALRVDNFTLTIANGNTVTVGDGTGQAGVIMNPVGGDSKITGGTLAFGTAEGVIYTGGTTSFGRLESAVTGSGGVTKFGPGNLVLQGASTFSGGLTIKDGGVVVAGNEVVNGGVITSSPLGTGTVTFAGGGMRTTSGGDKTVANPVEIDGRAAFFTGSAGKALTFTGPITLIGAENTLVVDAGGAVTFAGVVGENAPGRSLIKAGATALTLGSGTADAAPNTYTGPTVVNAGSLVLNKQAGTDAIRGELVLNGGTVYLAQANQIPDTSKVTILGGTLKLQPNLANSQGTPETFGEVVINGGDLQTNPSAVGTNTVAAAKVTVTGGTFSLNTGATVSITNLTVSGGTVSMSGNASTSLLEIGNGGLHFSNVNTTPTILLNGGASGTRLRLSGDVTFTGSSNTNQVNFARGTVADVAPLIELNGTRTFSVDDGAAPVDVAVGPQLIDGPTPGGLVKNGAGTLSLVSGGSYTGGTTVNGGTLLVGGTLSGNVAVNAGTLRGNGFIDSVSVGATGTFAPGNTTDLGILTAGNLTLAGNSTLSLRVNVFGSDQVSAGAVTLGGAGQVALNLTLAYDPSDDGFESFTILDNSGNAPTVGLFKYGNTVLGENSQFVVTSGNLSQAFQITYQGGTGNDVVLTAIPEPGSAAALVGCLGVMIGFRRFRRGTRE
ncbi:beta strand repeat-containing protein [Verrucomicrobiota bacterium sgz303538]